jgi:hypothetical protein
MFLSFCTKDSLNNIDYFIFGDSYGECLGNCANFYLIKDHNIYPDSMNIYYNSPFYFKKSPLSKEKYDLAKKLVDDFPDYLAKNPNQTIGCPDCHDQGGIHIEIKENGTTKSWHIDTEIIQLPAQIRSYLKEVQDVILQLK